MTFKLKTKMSLTIEFNCVKKSYGSKRLISNITTFMYKLIKPP